ncbi:MAG: helix-turn-helix transcriptional regulator [Armatimonadetes bacterium]|nr:helix-turn-helix transcriptional regulator [Armatimonadota bacterium]
MIRPNVDTIKASMARRGWNATALAYHTGLSFPTVTRLLSGDYAVGERVIAALLSVFPELSFDDLFEVVREPEEVAS